MTTSAALHQFSRRVAFGLRPGQPLPADPLAWAVPQIEKLPPIEVLGPDGQPRTDLPAGMKLISDTNELMRRFQDANDVEDELFAQSRKLAPAEYERLRQERLALPFHRLEHWKEVQARASTALYGQAPVFERFWHFWSNHFMVAPGTQRNDVLVGPYQRALRAGLLGSYKDLLLAAVTHPGMLVYLDNIRNTGPGSKAKRQGWTQDSVNENLGRELLELFTLSPAAGYTQQDVEQTTLILTGWGVQRPDKRHQPGTPLGTRFNYDRHEPGSQTVLGKTYRAFVRQTGKLEDLVADLAVHQATLRHLSHKLCVYFIDDEPPEQAVAHVEQAFLRSNGHLPAVHEAVLQACWFTLGSTRKLASPEAWLWQCHTVSGLALPQAVPLPNTPGLKTINVLHDLGQALPRCPQPNGWPIKSVDWLSREMLDRRVRWVQMMVPDMLRGPRRLSPDALGDLLKAQLPDGQALTNAQAALARRDPATALSLLLLSPEFLWS